MSENIGVVDWFTKNRYVVTYPEQSDKMVDELISEVIQIFNKESKMKNVADEIYNLFENNDLLNDISSDSRFPVCSLFHHLKNTSGIAVCLLLQKLDKDPSYMEKYLGDYEISSEYRERDLVALVRIAAILHDIGKPRSHTSGSKYQQYHYHTKQTREILEHILSSTSSSLVDKFELGKILPSLASKHHGRDAATKLENLLSKADTVASAADRVNEISIELGPNNGLLTVTNRDKIFPHEINFDEGDLKCLETPHTEILGNGDRLTKKVQLKESNADYAKPFIDHTTGGGPSVYLKNSGKRNLGNIGILSLDTMGIQGFIGEAEKLKMLRGGSFLVDHILDLAAGIVSKYVCKEAILFKGGGNMLALIPDTEKCRALLEKEIEKCITNESRRGLKAAVVTFSTELDKVAGDFNIVLDESQEQLDLKKNSTYSASIIPNEKDICKYCSTRPLPPSSDMCQVCTIKNQHGEAEKWRMSNKYIDKVYGARRPTEISHLGNSIGALMIDGNMMGRMFQQTTTPAEYTFKSQSFAQRFDRILKDTINEFLEDEQKRNELVMHSIDNETYIGIEVVYSGGDDVLILMNAKGVIQFAELFIDNIAKEFTFEKKFHDGSHFINPVITVSGGIAIADNKFPIYFLLNAARKMESRSKEAFRNETETDERGIIRLPNGSIAITGISSAMPTGDYSSYVMDNEISGSLLQLKEMISIALNKSSTALISDLLTCGSSEHERLNLIKYMYSSLQRKSTGVGLDECEWMANVLRNPELLEASRMIIPHILHSSKGGEA